ncbi:hypothetical protein [Corynebacterium endometrii]|uniref:Uncharacterized protein n=1 Tax=Corynebacterium endometrii TaxID=2488819 RepID=A0A4P7QCX3_9CORY|nr:hypothetical protein [Corynebacterium endometrii]QCB27411.1 hypothetical protein CENDO_00505 [Corynebacterium endometrii]
MPPSAQRRATGAFYTPPFWAAQAHAHLDRALPGWREWTVWDPACGTGNLVQNLEAPRLLLSTLDAADLASAPGAKAAAQYDFLSGDPVPAPVDAELKAAAREGRPVLFLMNPPYASSANQDSSHKAGATINATGRAMRGLGPAAQQLYTQFLFRIMQLQEEYGWSRVAIGMFSSARFMGWPKFMGRFSERFGFVDGFYFNASAFEDVANTWAIAWTVWDSAHVPAPTMRLELRAPDGRALGTKNIHPVERPLSAWLKEATSRAPRKAEPYVRLSGATRVNTSANPRGFLTQDAFGYLHNNSDSVEHSAKYVGLYSTAFGSANGVPVTPANFERACVVFAARKATVPPPALQWMTGHDTYQAPGRLPRDFVSDCVVYALCSRSGSQQSGLRGVKYAGHALDVHNEFFWQGETFVARWLAGRTLSEEARRVLALLDQLVSLTPHCVADAGFRQRLPHAPQSWLADYSRAFTALDERVHRQVIDLGFLPSSISLL